MDKDKLVALYILSVPLVIILYFTYLSSTPEHVCKRMTNDVDQFTNCVTKLKEQE